jgi:hypothetical protein
VTSWGLAQRLSCQALEGGPAEIVAYLLVKR